MSLLTQLSLTAILLSVYSYGTPQDAGNAAPVLPDTGALSTSIAEAPGGIVVSRTITVAGHDFTQHFLAAWRDRPGSEHYTLAIVERPSARWGSEVWIEYAQRRVFHARLPNVRAALRQAGESAADATFQAVLQADMQRKLIKDADLAADEF